MARKRKKKSSGRTLKSTDARRADKYVCYEKSVQEPEADVPFLNRVFRNRSADPKSGCDSGNTRRNGQKTGHRPACSH